MKYYLLIEIRAEEAHSITRIATIEDGLKEYELAKRNKDNLHVYLTMIVKEVDL